MMEGDSAKLDGHPGEVAQEGGTASRLLDGLDLAEMIPFAMAIIDGERRLRFANRCFRDLLRSSDCAVLRDGLLCAAHPDDHRALSDAVGVMASGPVSPDLASGICLPLAGTTGGRGLYLRLQRVFYRDHSATASKSAESLIVVFAGSSGREIVPAANHMKALFNLTPREAQLCQALLATGHLVGAAELIGISTQSARTYLKSVFAKTRTHTQLELIRLILAAPAWRDTCRENQTG